MNNKISVAQLQALIIIAALGFEILILPVIINSIAELCIILITGFMLCLLAIYSNINITNNKILCFIYSIKNILVTVLLTKILADVIKSVLLNDMALYKILLIVILVAGYAAYKGIEVISRISQMLFWFIVVGTIYVYVMAISDVKLNNIIGNFSVKGIFVSLLLGFIINIAEIIILIKPFLTDNNKGAIKGIIFGFIMLFLICFAIIGKLGVIGMKSIEYPSFEIMYTSNLPNVFIKRQEGIFISLWIISALISIFIYFGATVDYMKIMKIDKKTSVILLMIFVFVLALCYKSSISAISTYCFLQVLGGIITVLIIPLIFILRKKV